MRGLKGFAPLILIGTAGLAWLLFLSEPGSHWLTAFLAPPPGASPVIGRLASLTGTLKRIHGGDMQQMQGPLASPIEIHDGDRLETDQSASAIVVLNSQDELELGGLTALTFQLWNEQDPFSPVYMTLKTGALNSRKSGVRGRAYVVYDGRLYLPGQKPEKKPMALTVSRSAPSDMHLAENPTAVGGDAFESDSQNASAETEKAPTLSAADPETLSNEYIDEMIASRQAQFQKCWLSHLKKKSSEEGKGQIVLQFEIGRRGKVKDLKIADSNIGDESLQKCVINVVERISFRSFKGPEISLSYPIRFE